MGNKSCINNVNWQQNQEKLKKKWEKRWISSEKKYYKNPKLCAHCETPIKYSKEVKRRKFCSHKCSASFYNPEKKEKENKCCLNCGDALKKNAIKYCSRECTNAHKYKIYIEKWKNGEISGVIEDDAIPVKIRRYIFEKFESKCTKCGWSKVNPYTGLIPLHVDHTDGNSRNNKEENLDLICPSCHSLTGNYGALNKGKSKREYRNKWRHKYKELMGV